MKPNVRVRDVNGVQQYYEYLMPSLEVGVNRNAPGEYEELVGSWVRQNIIMTYRADQIDCYVFYATKSLDRLDILNHLTPKILERVEKLEGTYPQQLREKNAELEARVELLEIQLNQITKQLDLLARHNIEH